MLPNSNHDGLQKPSLRTTRTAQTQSYATRCVTRKQPPRCQPHGAAAAVCARVPTCNEVLQEVPRGYGQHYPRWQQQGADVDAQHRQHHYARQQQGGALSDHAGPSQSAHVNATLQ